MGDEITVVRWMSEPEYDRCDPERDVGDFCGGRLAVLTEADYAGDRYAHAVFRALDERGPVCGFTHQCAAIPEFSDGAIGCWSLRAWGDLVGAWWTTRYPDDPVTHTAFAWDDGGDRFARWEADQVERAGK